MTTSHFTELYSSLTIVIYNIASNVRLTLLTHTVYPIRSARGYPILPDVRHTASILIISSDLDTILMRLLNEILYHMGLVILNVYTTVVQSQLILHNLK